MPIHDDFAGERIEPLDAYEQAAFRDLALALRAASWDVAMGVVDTAIERDLIPSLGALGTLTVSTTRRLAPGEGLTVVAALPEGVVDPPTAGTLLWYEILDNRQWIIGGIGFLVVLIYYVVAWSAVGRDPKRGTVIPLFHPPQGISPALANYIHNWGLT